MRDTPIHPRPSLIRGVAYPITDESEVIIDLTWQAAMQYMRRREPEDTLLNYMREEVERIRREEVLT
jgi:hypothetical protein